MKKETESWWIEETEFSSTHVVRVLNFLTVNPDFALKILQNVDSFNGEITPKRLVALKYRAKNIKLNEKVIKKVGFNLRVLFEAIKVKI